MKIKYCIIIASVVLVFNSCKKEEATAVGESTFSFYSNSKIDSSAGFQINSGNFTVFEYNHKFPDDPSIADDEQSDKIIFQIPNNQTSFTIADAQLNTAIFKRWHYCFCFFIGPHPNIGGSVSGTKTNNIWQIVGSIKTSTKDSIIISGTYQLK